MKHETLNRIHNISITLVLLSISFNTSATKLVWDLTDMFGVDTVDAKPGTDLALEAARDYFSNHPNDTIVLFYPEGNYDFLGVDHMINFGGGFNPGANGRLEITGEGYDKTVFITKNREVNSIHGRNVYHVLFKGIHFTRDYTTVTQGDVVSVSPGEVVMDLHEDFPSPDSLWQYGITGGWGMYLKRYTSDLDDPHIFTENNSQVAWNNEGTYQVSGRTWRFALKNASELPPYKNGDVIGVKLKHGGQTYWFSGGDDIAFDFCKWTRKTRGVLRGGISNIRFSNCLIDRGPKIGGRTPCLSSPGGGPQSGQPDDARIQNVVVENCTVESTGDDNVAFFNVDGGVVRNCHFSDGFARGLLLYQSTYICVENNTFERCAPLYEGGDGHSNCSTPDFEPPSAPQNLEATEVTHHSVTLSWSPSDDNIGVSHYEVFMASNKGGDTTDTLYTVDGLLPELLYVFRVKAVDSAGNTSEYSDNLYVTTSGEPNASLVKEDNEWDYQAYPNPAKEKIIVKYNGNMKPGILELYDINGNIIKQFRVVHDMMIDITYLEKGVYFLRSKTENYIYHFIKI
ncbi:fibronectin type III domain-containing protein [Bacteroidota bacterium]